MKKYLAMAGVLLVLLPFSWGCGEAGKKEKTIFLDSEKVVPRDDEGMGSFLFLSYRLKEDKTPEEFTGETLEVKTPEDMPFLFFQAIEGAWLYCFLFTPGGGMELLFPGKEGLFPHNYPLGEHRIPKNRTWEGYLSEDGKYTIYMVVTREKSPEITSLLELYAKTESHRRSSVATDLKGVINKLRREGEFISNLDQKPNPYGGTVRTEEDLFSFSRPISIDKCFVRQINIIYKK